VTSEGPRRRKALLHSAASISALILHEAERWAALRAPMPATRRRAVSIAGSNGLVARIRMARPPAGFLLIVCQLARLQRIDALFANPLVGDCRRRLRFP